VGLRLLEEYETKREALRQALKEGEDSGIAPYTLHDLLDGLDDGDLESMNVEKYF
jgi:putative addiction module CopG family antidote